MYRFSNMVVYNDFRSNFTGRMETFSLKAIFTVMKTEASLLHDC